MARETNGFREQARRQHTFVDVTHQHSIGSLDFRTQPTEQSSLGLPVQRGCVLPVNAQHLLDSALRRLCCSKHALLDDGAPSRHLKKAVTTQTRLRGEPSQHLSVCVGADHTEQAWL